MKKEKKTTGKVFGLTKKVKSAGQRLKYSFENIRSNQKATPFTPSTWLIVYIIGAVLLTAGIISLAKRQIVINKKQQTLNELNAKIEMQLATNDELQTKLDGSLDDYIEEYARTKLGMVKPGERVYINTAG